MDEEFASPRMVWKWVDEGGTLKKIRGASGCDAEAPLVQIQMQRDQVVAVVAFVVSAGLAALSALASPTF
jgi:hypothetical protein